MRHAHTEIHSHSLTHVPTLTDLITEPAHSFSPTFWRVLLTRLPPSLAHAHTHVHTHKDKLTQNAHQLTRSSLHTQGDAHQLTC